MIKLILFILSVSLISTETLMNSDEDVDLRIEESSCNSNDSMLLFILVDHIERDDYNELMDLIGIFCELSSSHFYLKKPMNITFYNPILERNIGRAIDFINNQIVSDMKNLAEKSLRNYFDQLQNISEDHITYKHSETVLGEGVRACNLMTRTRNQLLEAKDPKEFFHKVEELFKNLNILKDLENFYLQRKFSEIRFLFSLFHENVYRSAAFRWSQPFREFMTMESPNLSNNCYHKIKIDTLTEKSLMANCEKVKRSNLLTSLEPRFIIRGNTVKLSDINFEKCIEEVRLIEIFALDTVVINTNLNLSRREIEVAIIAPTWKVVGKRTIDLSGENGGKLENPQAANGSQSENKNGDHGMAGLPGGPAGKFIGIAGTIINAKDLKIVALGGDGGPGQNGGNGAGESGRGGDGGAGGLGGKRGTVEIYELFGEKSRDYSVEISSADGKVGPGGDGGYPEGTEQTGRTAKDLCNNRISLIYNLTHATFQQSRNKNSDLCGKKGASLKMRRSPDYLHIQQNLRAIITKYKSYVNTHLKDMCSCERSILIAFFDLLNTHPKVNKLYDTLGLVEEFKELELQYFTFREEVNFTSSYVALQKQIGRYLEAPNLPDEDTKEYKDVLKDLNHDLSDRIKILHSRTFPVSTDVKSAFMSLITKPFQKMQEQEKITEVLIWLDDLKRPFKNGIKNALHMIGEVRKAMDDFETNLNQDIASLLDEISRLKEDHQKEAVLTEVRHELQSTIQLRIIIGDFRVLLGVLEMINPALHLAATVISSAHSIIRESKTEPNVQAKRRKIPKTVYKTMLETKSFFIIERQRQQDVFEQQKTFLQQMKTSVAGKKVVNKVWESSKHLRNLDTRDISIRNQAFTLQATYDEQEEQLMKWLEEAKTSNKTEAIENFKAGIEAVKYLKVTSYVFQSITEIMVDMMTDRRKVDEVNIAMKAAQRNLKRFHRCEMRVYNAIEPMLGDMMKFLGFTKWNEININANIPSFDKWDVTDNLKKIKNFMSVMIEDYIHTEDIEWIFDKIHSIFDIFSEIYTKLLKCEKEKLEKKFPNNLHITHNSNLLISDSSLRNALARLQEVISYNVVHETYDQFIAVFKQFTFPQTGIFLDKLEKISVHRGVDYVMANIMENSDRLNSYLKQPYWINLLNRNKILAPFWGSSSERKSAFFVWKNEKYSKEIGDILRGIETTLEAKLTHAVTEDGLKFKRVEVIFTPRNLTIQNKLHEALANFNVTLTHHGDSKYKYFDNIYEIENTPTTIEYSLLRNCKSFPLAEPPMYMQIKNGDPMLSPFATWTIKLKSVNLKPFQILEQFINEVDLELVGSGQFLHTSSETYINGVGKYYTRTVSIG